jgi:hypothetical protein
MVNWVFLARFMRSPHEHGLGDHGNGTAHKHPWTKSRKTVNRAGIPGCQLLSALGNRAGDRHDRHTCIPGTYGHLSGIQALKLQPGTYPTRMTRGPARPTLWGPICPRAGPSIGTPGSRSGRYSTGSLVESIFHLLEMSLLREIIHPHRSHYLLLIPGCLPQTNKGCSRGLSFNW